MRVKLVCLCMGSWSKARPFKRYLVDWYTEPVRYSFHYLRPSHYRRWYVLPLFPYAHRRWYEGGQDNRGMMWVCIDLGKQIVPRNAIF